MPIEIGNYHDAPEVNYEDPPLITWRDFFGFRNCVLHVLRAFGSAGPMGDVDLAAEREDGPVFIGDVVQDPEFFVVDDMYNEHDRISTVECDAGKITAGVMHELLKMLEGFSGWQVSFSLGDSGILVFRDKVLKGGRRFWDCQNIEEIAERCATPVDFGPAEPLQEEMYFFWLAAIRGGIDFQAEFPPPASRQWQEVEDTLRRIRAGRWGKPLSSFDYDQIRNDLHPQTRRELIRRCLAEIDSMSAEKLKGALRNIRREAAEALTGTMPLDRPLIDLLETALEVVARKLEAREAIGWWSEIMNEVRQPANELKEALSDAMRRCLTSPEPAVQLAAIFGLAKLRTTDLATVVEARLAQHPEWRANAALLVWFEKLKRGSTSYPDKAALAGL